MKKEKMILVPAAFLMTAMLAFPVMASEKIEEVTIDISAVLTDSDNLEVEAEVSEDRKSTRLNSSHMLCG